MVTITRICGSFEIVFEDAVIAEGSVEVIDDAENNVLQWIDNEKQTVQIKSADIYKELLIKGYNYGKNFQTLIQSNSDGKLEILATKPD